MNGDSRFQSNMEIIIALYSFIVVDFQTLHVGGSSWKPESVHGRAFDEFCAHLKFLHTKP